MVQILPSRQPNVRTRILEQGDRVMVKLQVVRTQFSKSNFKDVLLRDIVGASQRVQ